MSEFLVPPASKNDIKNLALEVRERFQLYDAVYFPVVDFIEMLMPINDRNFNYEIVEDYKLGLDAANYNPQSHLMKIRESVYNGACDGNGRDRFTLAHEIGHYFMHSDIDLLLNRIDRNTSIPLYRNSEWQANTFASALLMPDHIIKNLTPPAISDLCGTSLSAANIAYKQKKK